MSGASLCKTSVLRLYQEVIDDVISGVRELFLEDGVDEQVLLELKQTWETKLMASKAVQNEQEEKPKEKMVAANGFPKQQVAQQLQQMPPQQMQQQQPQVQHTVETRMVPIQITLPPQPGTDGAQRVLTIQVPATALQGNQLQKVLTGPVITATMGLPATIASSLLQQHVNAAFNNQPPTTGQPQQQPQQQQVQQVHVVTKGVVQTDGQVDDEWEEEDVLRQGASTSRGTEKSLQLDTAYAAQTDRKFEDECIEIEFIFPSNNTVRKAKKLKSKKSVNLIQADGPNDTSDEDDDASEDNDDDDDLDEEKDDDNEEIEDEGGEEEPLNSGDDVTDDEPADLFDTDNIVVCQYDKIIRNRNKWKFYLKDGIMNLNGLDYVFQKANGDAEW